MPDAGPAILVLYHATLPVDAAFVTSNVLLKKNRKLVTIVDRFVVKIPGYKSFMEAVEQTSGSVESCVEMMDNEDMLLIYPGGIRELMLGDNNYEVMWRPTAGFAKVAVQAKVATKSRD